MDPSTSSLSDFCEVASWLLGSEEEELESQMGEASSGGKQRWALGV